MSGGMCGSPLNGSQRASEAASESGRFTLLYGCLKMPRGFSFFNHFVEVRKWASKTRCAICKVNRHQQIRDEVCVFRRFKICVRQLGPKMRLRSDGVFTMLRDRAGILNTSTSTSRTQADDVRWSHWSGGGRRRRDVRSRSIRLWVSRGDPAQRPGPSECAPLIPSRSEGRLWGGLRWQAAARSDYAGGAGKESFESAPIDAKEIGLVQIVLCEGFAKSGEDFEVVGLRGRPSNLIITWEFILLWPLRHKLMRTGAMRCALPARFLRKGGAEVLRIAGNMECGRSGRSSRTRKALRMRRGTCAGPRTMGLRPTPRSFC